MSNNDGLHDVEPPERQLASERRASRRGFLQKGLGIAAATLGTGAVLEMNAGSVHAQTRSPNDNVGNFSSSNSSVPAVTASGTNGATGLQASSDTGDGIVASSTNLDGIHATSSASGHSGVYAEGVAGGFGVYGKCRGGTGVLGEGGTGTGLYGSSTGGNAIIGYSYSNSGTALQLTGHMQLMGDSVGQATLAAGHTSVTVTTSAATATSNVLLTLLSKYKGTLWVTLSAGSFTINCSAAPTSSIKISYLIIN